MVPATHACAVGTACSRLDDDPSGQNDLHYSAQVRTGQVCQPAHLLDFVSLLLPADSADDHVVALADLNDELS